MKIDSCMLLLHEYLSRNTPHTNVATRKLVCGQAPPRVCPNGQYQIHPSPLLFLTGEEVATFNPMRLSISFFERDALSFQERVQALH